MSWLGNRPGADIRRRVARIARLVGVRRAGKKRCGYHGMQLGWRKPLCGIELVRRRIIREARLQPCRRRVCFPEVERADQKPPVAYPVLKHRSLANYALDRRGDVDYRIERHARLQLHRTAALHEPAKLPATEAFVRQAL